jgi:hypothetical protein
MTEKRKRKVARTEDRIESRYRSCRYPACGGPISHARSAEGSEYCDDECWYNHMMEENEPELDPEEDE